MADNYLEKRMEDLRAGRINKRAGGGSRGERVFVLGCELPDMTEETVRRLRGEGKRVAFAGMDNRRGTALARSVGAQYHPVDWVADRDAFDKSLRLIWRSWRGLDRVVMVYGGSSEPDGAARFPEALLEAVKGAVDSVRKAQPVADDGVTLYETV